MRGPFALLVNPTSAGGKSLRAAATAAEVLAGNGAEHRVVETTSGDNAREEAARAAETGEVVVAVGGDGLVRLVAAELRGRGTLGIVPGGRGNDFARVLGIPFDATAAAQLLIDGEERLLDVAEANGEPFIGIASLGFDSDANRIANETRYMRGNLVYLLAALRALAAWKPAHFTVDVDGVRHEVTGYTVAVGNSKAYGGGMFLLPHAELDDGRLEVMTSAAHSKGAFLRNIPRVFKGEHVDDPAVTLLSGAVVEVDADRPFDVYADGDPIASLPLRVTVEPRCLRVIAPAAG